MVGLPKQTTLKPAVFSTTEANHGFSKPQHSLVNAQTKARIALNPGGVSVSLSAYL